MTKSADWVKNIGHYDLLSVDGLYVDDLLTPASRAELLKDTQDTDPTAAREAFLVYLNIVMERTPALSTHPKPTATMQDLLGKKGLELYRAAIAEEGASRHFREAVFLKAIQYQGGPQLDKKALLWVGGPSASGKTYAANAVFASITPTIPKKFDRLKSEMISQLEGFILLHPTYKPELEFFIEQIERLSTSESAIDVANKLDNLMQNVATLIVGNDRLNAQLSFIFSTNKPAFIEALEKGNHTVLIDGGVEREVSQMRQMVLQLALAKGYNGIRDLHQNTKLTTKEYVKAAALADPNLSLVIPETFAESATNKRFDLEGAYKKKEMQAYQSQPNLVQYFSETTAEKGQEARFQNMVYRSANARAYLSDEATFSEDDIKMNNRDLPCESKDYNPLGFRLGTVASKTAKDNLKGMNPEGWTVQVINDLIFVRQKAGHWVECEAGEIFELKLSKQDFDRWNNLRKLYPIADLKVWYAARKKEGNLAPVQTQLVPNDLIQVSPSDHSIEPIQISARDFERWLFEKKAQPDTCPPLLRWCYEEYKKQLLITPAEIIFGPLVKKRSVSAPANLENVISEQFQDPEKFKTTIQIPSGFPRKSSTVSTRSERAKIPNVMDKAINAAVAKMQKGDRASTPQATIALASRTFSIARDQEFANAKQLLQQALSKNPNLTSFKISRKRSDGKLDHSFICLKNAQGEFELFRMAAEILGKGTEGKVKIIETESGAKFVVKISQAADSNSEKIKSEFEMMNDVGLLIGEFILNREEKFDKTLQKNIGNKQYVIQPYVKGQELSKLLATLNENQRMAVFKAVLENIKVLHKKGIIHRDIKPENIIVSLDSEGNVDGCTLIDYGQAVRCPPGETVSQPYGGSPRYIAPELGRDEFQAAFNSFLKFDAELQALKAKRELLLNGKGVLTGELERVENKIGELEQRWQESKSNYEAVLGKTSTFDHAIDLYSVGVMARDALRLDLKQYRLLRLLIDDPTTRMSADDALKHLPVLHTADAQKRPEPVVARKPLPQLPSTQPLPKSDPQADPVPKKSKPLPKPPG